MGDDGAVDDLACDVEDAEDLEGGGVEESAVAVAVDDGLAASATGHAAAGLEVATGLDLGGLDHAEDGDVALGDDAEAVLDVLVDEDVAGEVDVSGGVVDAALELEEVSDGDAVE